MVKIKIEKWGSLKGLSISISEQVIIILFVLLVIILGSNDLPSFLTNFLTHYLK